MKTCSSLNSLAAFSLLILSSGHNAAAADLTPSPISANTTPGTLTSRAQVETATARGTITVSGNVRATITSKGINGSNPLDIFVPVNKDETPDLWADHVREALKENFEVSDIFEISGTGPDIVLTRKPIDIINDVPVYPTNDTTLNLALRNDFTLELAQGIVTESASANTTPGFDPNPPPPLPVKKRSVAQVETATASGTITVTGTASVIVTAAGLRDGSVQIPSAAYYVPVSAGIPAIPGPATVTGTISATNNTTTIAVSSTAGLLPGQTLKKTAGTGSFGANPVIDSVFNDGQITVTTTTPSTSGTITFSASMPAVPADTEAVWANKIRAKLRDPSISNLPSLYAVGGDGTAFITLTRKEQASFDGNPIYATNDATLNISIENDSCDGIVPQSVSANTTLGTLENEAQVETITATGAATSSGNIEVTLTSKAVVGSPKKITVPVAARAEQSGSISGTATTITITGISSTAGLIAGGTLSKTGGTGSFGTNPVITAVDSSQITFTTTTPNTAGTITFIQLADTANTWAEKVRAALSADSAVSSSFTVTRSNAQIVLTRNAQLVSPGLSLFADNDPTLNVAIAAGSGSRGVFTSSSSANSVAGLLTSTAQVETATAAGTTSELGELKVEVTAAGLSSSPKSVSVMLAKGDTAEVWAGKVRADLVSEKDINDLFTVGGTGTSVSLTRKEVTTIEGVKTYPPNDSTLNIALVADSDGDGLADFDENNVHATDPDKIDSDGDGFVDSDEVANGTDPTDLNDKPSVSIAGQLHNLPNLRNEGQSVEISQSFTPFGQRPDTDKTSEDGSVAIRDENGVIIWVNNRGKADPIPNSSLAKTLYVSNTECVVWQNRFDGTFNKTDSISQIVMYRRNLDGSISASPTMEIPGTLLETSPISPSTYGFTLLGAARSDNGLESDQRYQSGSTDAGPVYNVRDVDKWDLQTLTLYRVTWDSKLQSLKSTTRNIPKTGGNLGEIQVLGNGSDGSFFFETTIARDFYDDVIPIGVKDSPGFFRSQTASFWITTTTDKERIFSAGEASKPTISAPYVTNTRIVLESQALDLATETPIGVQLRDIRLATNGDSAEAPPVDLDTDEEALPVTDYTRAGLPAFIYTIDSQYTTIKLHNFDAGLVGLGDAVTLPAPIVRGNAFVRNPFDGSLLIKTEGAGLVWVPAITRLNGDVLALGSPRELPNSGKGLPLFVSAREAVAWMNASAPLVGGVAPNADLAHFAIESITAPTETKLNSIAGRYVTTTPSLSPDAESEGWFISTFEKSQDRVALMRTYALRTAESSDGDGDGIPDIVESKTAPGTNPLKIDTDDDTVEDGYELYPYEVISGAYTWDQANLDAIKRGGKLAVIKNRDDYTALRSIYKDLFATDLWLGATDRAIEGTWLWGDGSTLNTSNWLAASSVADWSTSYAGISKTGIPWATGKPDNTNNADGLAMLADGSFVDRSLTTKLGYLIEYPRSKPKIRDGPGDEDEDGISDRDEIAIGSVPTNPDSDGDTLSDGVEYAVFHGSDADVTSRQFLGLDSSRPVFSKKGKRANMWYEGLLYNEEYGFVGRVGINISQNRAFTGTYADVNGTGSSLKGSFNGNGSLSYLSTSPQLSFANTQMVLQRQPNGRYHLHVKITTEAGVELYAKARPAIETKTYSRRSLTFEAASVTDEGAPTGPAVGTGTLSRTAKANFQVYLPDASGAIFGGSILDGDVIALYVTKSSKSASPVLLGNLKLGNRPGSTSNIFGTTRLVSADYDQERQLAGTFYVAPKAGGMPVSGYDTTANNARFNWSQGELDDGYQVVRWSGYGIIPPSTQYDKISATFTAATGLMKVIYALSDESRNLYQVQSTAYAVVNQALQTVNGFYAGSPGSKWQGGAFNVTPNTLASTVPSIAPPTEPILITGEVAFITPQSKQITYKAQNYDVAVTANHNWDVVIPVESNWITAKVINDDKSSFGNVLAGRHNARVQLTIQSNTTEFQRFGTVNIGGIVHTVMQKPEFFVGVVSSIDPPKKKVLAATATYTISVRGTDNWQISIPSDSNWIRAVVINQGGYVYPNAPTITGVGNATVRVTVASNLTRRNRKGVLAIGNKTHTIEQAYR